MEKQDFVRALSFLERAQRMHSPFSAPTSEAAKLAEMCNKRLAEQQQTMGGKRREEEERGEQKARRERSPSHENSRGSSHKEEVISQKSDTEKQQQGPKEGLYEPICFNQQLFLCFFSSSFSIITLKKNTSCHSMFVMHLCYISI